MSKATSSSKQNEVFFIEKGKVAIEGIMDILLQDLNFEYVPFFKRKVCRIDQKDLESSSVIRDMIDMIRKDYNMKTLGVFANYYEDGNQYAPYHKDSYETSALTISFGGSREFLVKDEEGKVTKHLLENGDVCFFNNVFNDNHKHSVPIRKKMNDPRISLLFFVD